MISPPMVTCLSALLSSPRLESSGTKSSLLSAVVEGTLETEVEVLKPTALKVFSIVVSVTDFHALSIHHIASSAVILISSAE